MRMFELLPRPLGSIFRKLTHFACNSPLSIRYSTLTVQGPAAGFLQEASP